MPPRGRAQAYIAEDTEEEDDYSPPPRRAPPAQRGASQNRRGPPNRQQPPSRGPPPRGGKEAGKRRFHLPALPKFKIPKVNLGKLKLSIPKVDVHSAVARIGALVPSLDGLKGE